MVSAQTIDAWYDAVHSSARNDHLVELTRATRYVLGAGVSGDVAEFGTMDGTTAVWLACSLKKVSAELGYADTLAGIAPRHLHLFDSFEGLPEASSAVDERSPNWQNRVWTPGSMRGLTPDDLMALCARHWPEDQIRVYQGWFKDSVNEINRGVSLALVHVDCDLYSSAFDVLSWLFGTESYSDGCIVLFDDWFCNRGSAEFGEARAWEELTATHDVRFTSRGGYGSFGMSFILHRPNGR